MYDMMKLEHIATIFTGYSFRQPDLVKPRGKTAVVQMKDISENPYDVGSVEGFTDLTQFDNRHRLLPGDILLTARGIRTVATRFEPVYENTIASAAFFVIRPNSDLIDSAYLHWYLNQSVAQNWFDMGKEQGSTVAAIPLTVVQELPVPLPPFAQQQAIGNLARLTIKEHHLSVSIAQKRQAKRNRELELLINQSAGLPDRP